MSWSSMPKLFVRWRYEDLSKTFSDELSELKLKFENKMFFDIMSSHAYIVILVVIIIIIINIIIIIRVLLLLLL